MWKLKNKYILFLIISFLFISAISELSAQNQDAKRTKITYKGTVVDNDGQPISNARIYASQGADEATTNKDGEFSIQIVLGSTILVESDGYATLKLSSLDADNKITLSRSEFLFGEKDVIPMAFHDERKGETVSNVAKIDVPQILKNDNLTRFQQLLTTYGSGIRDGINILGLGDAIVIVDGLPRDASSLQVEEIESISILKDVNSTVLYGSQAKNGVILVKTKRGKAHKKIVNISLESGFNVPIVKPKYLNSRDYMTLYNEAQVNDNPGKTPDYDPDLISKYDGSNPYRYPDVDYYGSQFLKSMYNSTRFVGEFAGGNNIARYYTNVGWEHNGVLYKSDEYNYASDRLRVRANVDFNITDHITSYIDAAFVFDMSNRPRTDFYTMASTYRPNDYALLLSADMFDDPSIIDPLIKVNGNNILGGNTLVSKNSYGKNVMGELNLAGYLKNYRRTMQFNAGVAYDLENFVKGLTLKANVQFDTYGGFSEAIMNNYALYEPVWNDATGKIKELKTINQDAKTGVLTLTDGELARTLGTNILLDFDRTFASDHHVSSTLVGYYSMASIKNSLYTDKNAHIGLRVNYDYQHRYLADFSSALSNSVKLPPGHRTAFSPSVGLGWVVSNESFWKKNNILDYLKLRVSAGILQTDASDSFGYNRFREIYSGGSAFGTGDVGGYSSTSIFISQMANPDLGLEKMKNVTVGLNTVLLNKSLFIDANYYKTRYSDQVIQRSNYYPAFMARAIPYENYNSTDYTGFDFSAQYRKSIGGFNISAGLNLLYSISKYVKVDEVHNNSYQYLAGQPTDAFRGLVNQGFFATDVEAKASNQLFGTIRRGDLKYADMDNNGFIDDNDKVIVGNYTPRWVTALNVTVEYKKFSLFASANARLKYNWIMSSTGSPNNYFWVDGDKKYSEVVWGRWTDATAESATYPRLSAQSNKNNFRDSDFWIRNGNSLSIGRIQMNYTLPQNLISFVKNINVYLRGDNLFFFAEDADLRQVSTTVNTRNYTLGLKASF